jgi:hypothetical protein
MILGHIRSEERNQADEEQKEEVGPYYRGLRTLGVAQEMVVVDPNHSDKQIADGIAGKRRPKCNERPRAAIVRCLPGFPAARH